MYSVVGAGVIYVQCSGGGSYICTVWWGRELYMYSVVGAGVIYVQCACRYLLCLLQWEVVRCCHGIQSLYKQ